MDLRSTTQTANQRDAFLARNGLLYGKIYGLALTPETFTKLGLEVTLDAKMVDEYMKDTDAPNALVGSIQRLSNGPVLIDRLQCKIRDDAWEQKDKQPEGYAFFNGDTKPSIQLLIHPEHPVTSKI